MPNPQLLSLNSISPQTILVIPENQRGFAWTKGELNELLKDLELADPNSHYFGTLVLSTLKRSPHKVGRKKWDFAHIEDGQQRITTVFLIARELKARLDLFAKSLASSNTERSAHLSSIARELEGILFTSDSRAKLQSDVPRDQAILDWLFGDQTQTKPTSTSPPHSRLYKMASEIKAWAHNLPDDSTTEAWADRLMNLGKFSVVDLESEGIDRHLAFSCINSRGVPLTEFDRVKNYCLMLQSKRPNGPLRNSKIQECWHKSISTLDKFGITGPEKENTFLSELYRTWTNKPSITNDQVSDEIVRRFGCLLDRDDQALETELSDFVAVWPEQAAGFAFADARRDHPEVTAAYTRILGSVAAGAWINRIHDMQYIGIARPILTAMHVKSAGDLAQVAEALEKYIFRAHAVLERRTDLKEPERYAIANEVLRNSKTGSWVIQEICDIANDASDPACLLSEVIGRLGNGEPKYGRANRSHHLFYFLYEYDLEIQGGLSSRGHTRSFESNKRKQAASIEHVLPQSIHGTSWENHWTAADAEAALHRLGNLTLTLNNSSLGNREFKSKCNDTSYGHWYLHTNATQSEREVATKTAWHDQNGEWVEDSIRQREAQLLAFAYKRWHLGKNEPHQPIQLPKSVKLSSGGNQIDKETFRDLRSSI